MRGKPGSTAVKVVVTGPGGAGRTTLIRTISEITVLSTATDLAGPGAAPGAATGAGGVAMDLGRITVDRDLVLYLLGAPDRERLDAMWDVLRDGMLGYVVLVDATRPDTVQEAASLLAAFRAAVDLPYVVAVNRAGGADPAEEQRVRDALDLTDGVPVVPCDATDRESVKTVLLALLDSAVETLEPAS